MPASLPAPASAAALRAVLPDPLPELAELAETLHVVRLPMAVRFRGLLEREVALLRGPAGWGEFGPFPEYGPPETGRWLAAAIESAHLGRPEPVRTAVPVNATVPAVPPEQIAGVLARNGGGFAAVKVKVAEPGERLADDLARVAAVRDVVGPDLPVRVDANGAWSVAQALEAVTALHRHRLEYVEQPCATVADLAALRLALARAGVDVPVAADESVRRAEDPIEVARRGAADLVVVKVAPLGGVRAAAAVVAACGLPAVVSSAIDSSVGLAAGVALAATLPQLPHACGLGTAALLEQDVTAHPVHPVGGLLRPGAVEVDAQRLAGAEVEPGRRAWWLERLAAAHGALVTG